MPDIEPSIVYYRVSRSADGMFVERMIDSRIFGVSCIWVAVASHGLLDEIADDSRKAIGPRPAHHGA